MRLVVIGTGSVAPSPDRGGPAHWIEAGPVRLLLDCGAGTLQGAARLGLPWHAVTHVALTHFHPDHWTELPLLLLALRWGTEPARSAPLALLGPRGLTDRLGALAAGFGNWLRDPGYPLDVHELAPETSRPLADGVALETFPTPHTEESLAYAVRRGPHRIVYTGDTGPSAPLANWARGCDLLLAECSLPEDRAVPEHLTPSRAGALARDAEAGRLVLTHFYPPVEPIDPAAQAARVFSGAVVAARDGDVFVIEA